MIEPKDALNIIVELHGEKDTFKNWCKYFLSELFVEMDYFSGKRPGTDSGWYFNFEVALIENKCIKGSVKYDEDGYVDEMDYNEKEASEYLLKMIKEI